MRRLTKYDFPWVAALVFSSIFAALAFTDLPPLLVDLTGIGLIGLKWTANLAWQKGV